MTSSTARLPAASLTSRPRADGFTLIELILVMALLAIAASLAAPQMASFFRGRSLDQEARRMLSLTHYAQSRAVTEGFPMLLWIDPASGQYGLPIRICFRGRPRCPLRCRFHNLAGNHRLLRSGALRR